MVSSRLRKKSAYKIYRGILRRWRRIELKTNIYFRILSKIKPIDTPGRTIWINPMEITEVAYNFEKYDLLKTLGHVMSGDWDQRRCFFHDLKLYRALKAHFEEGIPLDETEFYNPNVITEKDQQQLNGTRSWDFITSFDYTNRVVKIDNLFATIKENGYKTQQELGGILYDEVRVRVSREGHILFENSIHRMSIAKILKLTRIPAIVSVRHNEWVAFKMQLHAFAKRQKKGSPQGGRLYQMPHHPDLQDIPYVHSNIDRFEAMKKAVRNKSGRVLDIGANLGFFSHSFEELGYQCIAVELVDENIYFLKKLKKAENRSMEVLHRNILKMIDKLTSFDIVIALNIFHHFLKTEEAYRDFIQLLKNLDMKEMFFEPHNPEEQPFQSTYKNLTNNEFIELILKHTSLNNYRKILNCDGERYLFHLWQ